MTALYLVASFLLLLGGMAAVVFFRDYGYGLACCAFSNALLANARIEILEREAEERA